MLVSLFGGWPVHGDAPAYGGPELRTFVTRARLLVRGDLGLLAFTDVGRMFLDGRSDGGGHSGYAVSAAYARGEQHRVYLRIGLPC